ncbi:MAG: RP853 family protein [Rickettsiaceae bacterium]|nr:RP853 family protein [Rickettsiaceae bacterium]
MTKNTELQNSPFQKAKVDFFYKGLAADLGKSIDTEVISPLANMFAFHFTNQEGEELRSTLKDVVSRIRQYLGLRVVAIYDFGIVMTLFSVGIAKEDIFHEDISESVKDSDKKQDILNELLMGIEDDNLTADFKKFLRDVMKEEDANLIINYIHSNSKSTQNIYKKLEASNKYPTNKALHQAVMSVIREDAAKKSTYEELRNIINMVCSVAIAATSSYACVLQFGLIAPFLIVPLTLYGVKLSLYPIDKVLEKTMDFASGLKGPEYLINQTLSMTNEKGQQQEFTNAAEKRLFTKAASIGEKSKEFLNASEDPDLIKNITEKAKEIRKGIDSGPRDDI